MTWYLDKESNNYDVYDHNGDVVGQADEASTGEVKRIMRETFETEANLGNSPVLNQYAGQILVHWIDGDIEFGSP